MNPTPKESSRWMPVIALAVTLLVAGLAFGVTRIPSPTERGGGIYLGRWPDGRELRVHRFVGVGGEPWDHWVDSDSGTWAVRDSSTGQWWGPASRRWGSNTVVHFQVAADGESGVAQLDLTGNPNPAAATNSPTPTMVLLREFRHQGSMNHFGFQIGRYGAEIGAIAQVPAFDRTVPFHRAVSDHLWTEAREAMRAFMSQRWEQQWDAARWNWPATLSSWDLDWQAQPRLWRSNLASIAVFWYPQRGGNGDPTHWRGITLLWEAGRCIPLVWDDLFSDASRTAAFLKARSSSELTRHLDHDTPVEELPIESFTLTTHGLQLLFDPYTVASGADGAQVVHIPWTDLRPFLRQTARTSAGNRILPGPVAELIEPVLR